MTLSLSFPPLFFCDISLMALLFLPLYSRLTIPLVILSTVKATFPPLPPFFLSVGPFFGFLSLSLSPAVRGLDNSRTPSSASSPVASHPLFFFGTSYHQHLSPVHFSSFPVSLPSLPSRSYLLLLLAWPSCLFA